MTVFLLICGVLVGAVGYYLSAIIPSAAAFGKISMLAENFNRITAAPFQNYWNSYSMMYIIGCLLIYGCFVLYYIVGKKPTRNGEEQGSSKWENPKKITKKLADHNNKPGAEGNIVVITKSKNPIFKFFEIFRNVYYKMRFYKAD